MDIKKNVITNYDLRLSSEELQSIIEALYYTGCNSKFTNSTICRLYYTLNDTVKGVQKDE